MFGVTAEGFKAKRLADIKTELENAFRAEFGSNINLDPRGPFGQIIGIMADRLETQWELAEDNYQSKFPQWATGIAVDALLELSGLTRQKPSNSTADIQFFGGVGTIITTAAEVSKVDDPSVVFSPTESGEILAGSGQSESQNINFSAVPDAGDWTLEFDGQVTGVLAFNISAALLTTELENLSNIGAGNVVVTGNFTVGFIIDFQGTLAEQPLAQVTIPTNNLEESSSPVTATPSTNTEGILPSVSLPCECTTEGEIAAPANSLTVLDTAITGVVSVNNPLDAVLGQGLETDAEAKLRRDASLANPGQSTVNAILAAVLEVTDVVAARVFENDAAVEIDGRPPHSYEVVVQGGVDDNIFQVILDTKPAGIQTVGTLSDVLKDSQGFDKEVRFSRPAPVTIYVEIDLKTNINFPANGLTQAAANVLAYGDALNIGDDIIVIPALLCSLDGIAGIIDADVRIAAAPLPASAGTAPVTFTNQSGDLKVEWVGHGLQDGNRVKFTSTGILPTGLASDTLYFVRNSGANDFYLSQVVFGEIVEFVDSGTGTHTAEYGGFDENIAISDSERADFDTSRITTAVV